jgi:hypothetical protein
VNENEEVVVVFYITVRSDGGEVDRLNETSYMIYNDIFEADHELSKLPPLPAGVVYQVFSVEAEIHLGKLHTTKEVRR